MGLHEDKVIATEQEEEFNSCVCESSVCVQFETLVLRSLHKCVGHSISSRIKIKSFLTSSFRPNPWDLRAGSGPRA